MATKKLRQRFKLQHKHEVEVSPEWEDEESDAFSPGPGAMVRGPRMQLDELEVLRMAVGQNPTNENVAQLASLISMRMSRMDEQFSQLMTVANQSASSLSRGVRSVKKSVRTLDKKIDDAAVTIENIDEKADRASEEAKRAKADIKADMGKFATYIDRCVHELSEDVAATLEKDKGWLDRWTSKKKGMVRRVYVFLRAIGRVFHKLTGYYLVAREFIINTLHKVLSLIPGLSALFNIEELVRLGWFAIELLWVTGIINTMGALKGRPFLGYETIIYVINLVWQALGTIKSVFEFLFVNPVLNAFNYFSENNWFLIKCKQWYENVKMIFNMLLEWALDGKKMVYDTAMYMKDSAANATSTYVTQPIANAATRTAEGAYYYASPVVIPVANAASTYVGQPIANAASRAAEGVSFYSAPLVQGVRDRLPGMPSFSMPWSGRMTKRGRVRKQKGGHPLSLAARKHRFLTPSRGFRGNDLLNVPATYRDEVVAIQPIYDYAITYVHRLVEDDSDLSNVSQMMLEHMAPHMEALIAFMVNGTLPLMKTDHFGKLKRHR